MATEIRLQTDSKRQFNIEPEIAKHIGIMNSAMEANLTSDVFPLPNVADNTLRKIIDWIKHHKKELDEGSITDNENMITNWDKEFLNVDHNSLLDIIIATNYLGVTQLHNMACRTIAQRISGKTPEEVRQIFNIENEN